MTGCGQEFEQAVARDGCRRGIHQGMKIKRVVGHERRIEHHGDAALLVIDRRERGDRAGRDAEHLLH